MAPNSLKKGKNAFFFAVGILLAAVLFFVFLHIKQLLPWVSIMENPTFVADSTPIGFQKKGPTSTRSPSQTDSPEDAGLASLTPLPTATLAPKTVWIDPVLPTTLRNRLRIPQGYSLSKQRDEASINLTVGNQTVIGYWTYALVCPFPSLWEGVPSPDLKLFWEGDSEGSMANIQLLTLDQETKNILSAWWGPPHEESITVLPQDEILDALWPNPNKWAIIPFQKLDPHWKVLAVDGKKPIHKDYHPGNAILSIPISLSGPSAYISEILVQNPSFSNRNPKDMTSLLLTGVTALVRDTAVLMEKKGITYPAENIGETLLKADFTHISNEVPFASDCPTPDPDQPDLYFCSDDRYLELLDYIGTDIVELSGDHFGDWGNQAMLHTLELYQDQGWLTYGGGETLEQGLQPILFEHNGNRFAFIGCNAKTAPKYATASKTKPGAARCNFPWMIEEIKILKEKGIIVIVTLQHEEIYQYPAVYIQKRDFRLLADAGADIVSGSQAHQPQAIEFREDSFVHYGLGNLFFDQYYLSQWVETYQHADEAFIDLHVFYNNQHISTELLTLQFIDNAQARFMTAEERTNLLSSVFAASDW
jgi:poly-gamma-glutamate synthesis protein (capsule biosynthesis protein)